MGISNRHIWLNSYFLDLSLINKLTANLGPEWGSSLLAKYNFTGRVWATYFGYTFYEVENIFLLLSSWGFLSGVHIHRGICRAQVKYPLLVLRFLSPQVHLVSF